METSLYISFGVGILFLLLCIPVLLFLPETHTPTAGKSRRVSQQQGPNHEYDEDTPSIPSVQLSDDVQRKPEPTLLSVLTQRNMLLAFGVLYISNLRPATLNVLLQYVTVRFHWKTHEAAVLMSEVAVVNIVLFLFIVPAVNKWVSPRLHVRHDLMTWSVVLASLSLLALGALLIGLASSIRMVIPCRRSSSPIAGLH